jgi:hypothetical protein
MKRGLLLILVGGAVIGAGVFYLIQRRPAGIRRSLDVMEWIRDPAAHKDWTIQARDRCGEAPFLFPTEGFIGFLWDDSFRPGHRHQGIDIFGGAQPGKIPVYAAYDGYLTRLPDWKSTVIMRVPVDPLQAGRQIWLYYTHMANPDGNSYISDDFPPGVNEVEVKAGTLLGYQGNYSGTSGNPVGVHLHFSIVRDDGQGRFLNELRFQNTIDPSPYFGILLNAATALGDVPVCPTGS